MEGKERLTVLKGVSLINEYFYSGIIDPRGNLTAYWRILEELFPGKARCNVTLEDMVNLIKRRKIKELEKIGIEFRCRQN